MAAKKIRCICGKIYQPAIHPACPDCQTPCPDSQPLAPSPDSPANLPPVQDPLPLVPPEKQTMLDDDRKKRPWNYPPEPVPPQRKLILYGILLGLLVGGWLILRPHSKPHDPTPKPAEKTAATAALSTPIPADPPAPVALKNPTPAPEKAPAPVSLKDLAPIAPEDLAAEIAKAKPGATIKLAAGTYRSGFTIDRAIHLIGDSTGGPVIIQNDETGPLVIKAAGVVLKNLRLTGQPKGRFSLLNVLDKAEIDLRQCHFDTTGHFGVVGEAGAKIAASQCTFSTSGRGTGLQLEDASRTELTDCLFKNNRWGCGFRQAAQGRLKGCRFEQNGLPDQPGFALGATGEKTYVLVEQCTFTENLRGVGANTGGHLSVTGCTFKNNGVTDAPTHLSFGTVNASTRAEVLVKDCTFDSNRQGLAVQSGGSAKVENSQFIKTGLRAAHKDLLFYCNTVSAAGEGTKVSLYKTDLRQALQNGINLVEGATLQMEDCEVSGGLRNGLGMGVGDNLHSESTITNCRFLDNKLAGLFILPDSVVKITKSSISHNQSSGIEIAGNKATIAAGECDISQNGQCGILSFKDAFSVLDGCNLQGNRYGAQNGTPKGKDGSGLFLNSCTISDSREFGAGALDGTLNLVNCTFTNNKKNLHKAGGLILEQWTGEKPNPSEQRTGVEPTGKTGEKTGMAETTPDANPADSAPKKKPTPIKRKPSPPPASSKAEEIIRDVLRHIPR